MLASTIKTMLDVRQLLKRFGVIIYTGDPVADLELIEDECRELFEFGLLEPEEYKRVLLVIRAAKNRIRSGTD